MILSFDSFNALHYFFLHCDFVSLSFYGEVFNETIASSKKLSRVLARSLKFYYLFLLLFNNDIYWDVQMIIDSFGVPT